MVVVRWALSALEVQLIGDSVDSSPSRQAGQHPTINWATEDVSSVITVCQELGLAGVLVLTSAVRPTEKLRPSQHKTALHPNTLGDEGPVPDQFS
ncbi:hypothetical protein CT0861_11428 [Colletotrichum tofieldiae]|uniref:Uncharacterized protein n=1 Tax=Colletotrichum tofieldiae TaxID=708197 RepID=A0A166Z9M3_9PEZI|nr:hypothetical protein CT0861_11428 [Colletotrichum tofieldiae]